MPARWEDIRQQDKIFLKLGSGWQLQGIEVRVRDTNVLRLAAAVRAHGDIAIGAAREARVDARAECGLAFFAVAAAAVGDVEGPARIRGKFKFKGDWLEENTRKWWGGGLSEKYAAAYMTTRSPFLSKVTPSPSSSTMPMFSWPKVIPGSAPVRPSYCRRGGQWSVRFISKVRGVSWMCFALPGKGFGETMLR